MTQPIDTQTPSRRFFSRFLLLPGLMGGLSMLSSTLVLAQTETIDTIVPTAQNSKPRATAATPSAPRQSWRQRLRPEGSNSPTFSTRSQRVRGRVADSSSRQQRLRRLSTVLSSGKQRVRGQVADVVAPTRRQRVRLRVSNASVPVRQQQVKSPTSIPPTAQLPIDRVPSVTTPPTNLPDQFLARPSVPKQTTISDSATDYNNTYIDRTNYSVGTTRGGYEAPSTVILSERSTGCQAVAGQTLSGSICGTRQERRALVARTRSSAINQSINVADATRIPNLAQPRWANTLLPEGSSWARGRTVVAGTFVGTPPVHRSSRSYSTRRLPSSAQGPIAIQTPVPIRPPGAYYNGSTFQPPVGLPGYAYTGMVFPLSIPAPITSLFGWRVHPISGNQRFHTGTDLGAPLGTPVLAALAGNVAIADHLGGYGLAVVLEHNESSQQTLYAHLSEIFVQPGEWVEQGTVIGRVGSTGNSTGPHLHFETRQLTPEGWVATDPGAQLEGTMALLVQTLQTAQLPAIPQPTAQLPVVPQQTARIPERLPPVPQVPQEPNQLGS